jgi:uncharacterized protein (DUF488 family)
MSEPRAHGRTVSGSTAAKREPAGAQASCGGEQVIYTIGHSTLDLDTFVARLESAEVRGLADVRRFPSSRRHPQFNREALREHLAARGIEYCWFEALGGRRSLPGEEAPSLNLGLRVGGFRAYADYALTEPFTAALRDLTEWASGVRAALCCAEALWWRCHRRILADHLVARGWSVLHILRDGEVAPHELWEMARLTPAGPVYPPKQPELL